MRFGEVGSASDAGLYIALEKGYFTDENIEIERNHFTTAADMVPPLGTGQLDVGGMAPSAGQMNAIGRDIPLKIVADKGNNNNGFGFQAILVRKALWDSGAVRGPQDMKGRTVALPGPGVTAGIILDRYLQTGGLTAQDVDVVTMPFPNMISGLAGGSIDVAFSIEPFVTQMVEQGSAVVAVRSDEVLPGQQAVLVYSPKFADEQPDVARRFMLAYVKALRDYNDAFAKGDQAKRAEIVEILTRNTPVSDAALYDKMVMPGLDPNGRVDIESLNGFQDTWIEDGQQTARIDLGKIVDAQYVDWAVDQLGPYR